jgi:hypothetical protein
MSWLMRTLARFVLTTTAIAVPTAALAQQAEPTKPLPPLSPPDAPAPGPASSSPAPTPAPDTAHAPEAAAPAQPVVPEPPVILATPPDASDLHSRIGWRHEGFYLRVLLGGIGYASFWGDGPVGSASISGLESSGGVAIGGAIAPGFAIAGTIWGDTVNGTFQGSPFAGATISGPAGSQGAAPVMTAASTNASAALGEIGFLVDWHPQPTGGWHAGASVGLGFVGITNEADGSRWGGVALAGSLFGGYDWWLGRSWSLGLMLVGDAGSKATLNDSNRNDTGYRLTPASLSLMTSLLYY